MPWKETGALEERLKFIMDYESGESPFSWLCERYEISRKTGYKWVERYENEGAEGLRDRSRAPRRQARALDGDTVERIIAARLRHPRWGPRKLRVVLMRKEPARRWPANSTIGAVLKAHGLTAPRRRTHKSPPHCRPFSACERPNDVWCADYKGWFLTGDGCRCDPLTVTDAHSRFLLRCHIVPRMDYAHARTLFEAAFRQYGLPGAIRTDNGTPFASTGPGGLSRLSIWWVKLGIIPERIAPGKPQQNGRHERFHLTLKQETAMPPCASLHAQQRAFNRFRTEYNHERPHEALNQRPPATVYHPSPRLYRAPVRELTYPPSMTPWRLYGNGELYFRGSRVFLSTVMAHEVVGLAPLDERYFTVYFGPVLLGTLDTYRGRLIRPPRRKKWKQNQKTSTARPSPSGEGQEGSQTEDPRKDPKKV